MARRRAARQDSLELLLDTICNTFGGVLFIAIMVVMLLLQTGQHPEAREASPAPEELQALNQKLATLSNELQRMQEIRASQAAIVESLVPDAIHELLKRREQLLAEQARIQAEVDKRRSENAELAVSVEQVQADIREVEESLRTALDQKEQLQSLLESERQSRTQDVRLPVLRPSDKHEIGIIIRYGRLYLWHEYDRNLVPIGLNTRDFVILGEEDDGLATRPNPTRGLRLDDSPQTQQAIAELLKPFDRDRFYIATIVRPDSYGAFKFFRDQAIALGYEYRLMPVEADTPIGDRGGSGGQVQ